MFSIKSAILSIHRGEFGSLHGAFLFPPTNEVWGKVIFSQSCVIPSVHGVGGGGLHPSRGSASRGLCLPTGVRVCIQGMLGRPPSRDTTGYGQQVGSTHPTRMYSYYWPKQSFGQGNVFTCVCDSVHRGST